ncbi:MAG: histidine--tRNA ligase [Pseudomonadota bacterium]
MPKQKAAASKASPSKASASSDPAAKPAGNKHLARNPRGFPDRREATLLAEQALVRTVTDVYSQWGFEALETGAFEYADALGKFLPDDDRPNAGVFSLLDDDEQWISLRYDLTAPLARFAAENWQGLHKPFRRYAVGPVWRNEKPGPGRFRQFTQCDADTVGAPGFHADAEMVAMGAAALRATGLGGGDFVIRVNTRRLLNGILDLAGVTDDGAKLDVLRALDKLDRLGLEGVEALLGDGRLDESGDFTRGAGLDAKARGLLLDFANAGAESRVETLANMEKAVSGSADGRAGLDELSEIARALEALGTPEGDVTFDPTIVRGLEYYTGPVYEAEFLRMMIGEDGQPVQIGSIGGGGRYDDLVARFTGQPVPATGFSIGISRLITALETAGDAAVFDGPIVVLNMDRSDPTEALKLTAQLRAAGLRAEAYMGASGMRPQMKYADRRRSPAVVMAGEDELAKGVVTIKDLEAGAREAAGIDTNEAYRDARPGQFEAKREDMVRRLQAIVGAPDDA